MENNYFDNLAASWDTNDIHSQRTKAISAGIAEKLKPGKTNGNAMEFGSGTGILSFALQQYFNEILLVDGSKEMVKVANEKIAKSNLVHLKSIQCNLEKENIEQSGFDFIFTQMAMHHVGDIELVLKKFFTLMNSNAKIAIADLYSEDGTFHDATFDGHYGFEPDAFVEKMKNAGFKNICYHECFVIPRIREDKTVQNFPVFLLIAEK